MDLKGRLIDPDDPKVRRLVDAFASNHPDDELGMSDAVAAMPSLSQPATPEQEAEVLALYEEATRLEEDETL